VWVELPNASSTALAVRAQEHHVYLTPGPRFGGARLLERLLRLPFAAAPEQLRQAVATLSRLSPGAGAAPAVSLDPSYVA
jgi:aspartate/methionine/tyrosine aminotransferase